MAKLQRNFFYRIGSDIVINWDECLTDLKNKGLSDAAICGLEGPERWIKATDGLNVSQEELETLITNMGNVEVQALSGIELGGIKYILNLRNGLIRGGLYNALPITIPPHVSKGPFCSLAPL